MDRSLVERAQAGDRDAFAELATTVSDGLFALAQRILRDTDAAGDALQGALVLIWRDLPRLRDPNRFDAWSYRIVLNCCRSARRRSRRTVATVELQARDATVGDMQGAVAQRDELEHAFRRLTDEQRAVLALIYYRGLSIGEAADVLGIAPGTAKSRLHHARIAMRAALDAGARLQGAGRLA